MGEVIVDVDGRKKDTVDALNPEGVATDYLEDSAAGLASLITDKLYMLSPDSVNHSTVCIYRVPEKHRNKIQEAYTPRLISIGLIHQGKSELQGMERYKLKYLQNFLHTFRVQVQKLAEYVRSQEKYVCDCYEDIYFNNLVNQSKLKPSEVILLDGIFIVVIFLKNHLLGLREEGDIIFDNPWVSSDVLHDLLLFENQLPLRFLTGLYDTFVLCNVRKCLDDDAIFPASFNELAHKYFEKVGTTEKLLLTRDFRKARHFVEFLSILHFPKEQNMQAVVRHDVGGKLDFASCPTATELKAVGVKFLPGTKKGLLDVHFKKETGELTIPQLTVNDSTETFFRNVIAFEQFGSHFRFITSYAILLDNLIDTNKDVDVLIKNNIIKNELGSSAQVADLFNNLYKEFLSDPKEFYFSHQCRQLNDYRRNMWHTIKSKVDKWSAILGRDYFNSPWSIISVAAAFLLLGLSITQTLYAVLSCKRANN